MGHFMLSAFFLSGLTLSFCDSFSPTSHGREARAPPSSASSASALHLYLSAPEIGGILVAAFAGWLYVDGADDRARRQRREEHDAIWERYQEERARRAHIQPKDYWTEEELTPFDGERDEDGPILLAADGLVFNVYKGRQFYGPGGEYHLFAGRDATRFLARTITEEETEEEAKRPLTMAERAALAGWMFTLKSKYEVVGKLKGFDPSTTSMKDGMQMAWKDPRL